MIHFYKRMAIYKYQLRVLANLANVTQGQVAIAMLTDPSFVQDFKNGLKSATCFMACCKALAKRVSCGGEISLFPENKDLTGGLQFEYVTIGLVLMLLLGLFCFYCCTWKKNQIKMYEFPNSSRSSSTATASNRTTPGLKNA